MRSESPKWPPKSRIIFSEEARRALKKPAGQLVKGRPDEVAEKVKRIILKEKPSKLVFVGDYTSRKLVDAGLRADLYVIDGKTERKPVKMFDVSEFRVERVKNDPGTLNPEAVEKLHELLRDEELRDTVLFVEGEEDLLTLAAMLSAPDGSIIVYGQPGEGNVIVRVNEDARRYAERILEINRRSMKEK